MKSIRENVFETNSSSMHTLTVACKLKNKELYKSYLEKELERWKKEDGTYDIKIKCTEHSVDDDKRFDIRRYIPHFSVNDKMLYLLATIIQHYQQGVTTPPYDKSKYQLPWWKNTWNKRYQECKKAGKEPKPTEEEIAAYKAVVELMHRTYLDELKKYNKKNRAFNIKNYNNFREKIEHVESNIKSTIIYYLYGRDENFSYEAYKDKVKVTFEYGGRVVQGKSNAFIPSYSDEENDYFSTGCYGNEEFYGAVCGHYGEVGEWVCNPYSAVLAGSDEQDEEDSFAQEQEALRCINESFENGYNDYSDRIDEINRWIEEGYYSDDSGSLEDVRKTIEKMKNAKRVNDGKVIYPIGG